MSLRLPKWHPTPTFKKKISSKRNIEKWESYLLSRLKETNNCFVEIKMIMNDDTEDTEDTEDTTAYGRFKSEDCNSIKKSELISLMQNLCNKLNYNYFITVQHSDTYSSYLIILSIIHIQTQK